MKTVIAIADTTMGYGSPQILHFTKDLCNYIGGNHIIFQPFVPQKKFIDLSSQGYVIEMVNTIEHPWSWIGRLQYLRRVASRLNELKPHVLVISNYSVLPVLDFLTFKPVYLIHQALEDTEQFEGGFIGKSILKKIQKLASQVDFWIFPERNRAIHDAQLFGIPYKKINIFYNVTKQQPLIAPIFSKNNRLIYAGSVDFNRTVAQYFIQKDVFDKPIDVYGEYSGSSHQIRAFDKMLKKQDCRIRYFGEVSASYLNTKMGEYAYSLVYWLPLNFSARNAAPNKFFQAITAGVPVLSAPHPQCTELINRYNCGITLKDWSSQSFIEGLKLGVELLETEEYTSMVEGCRKAYLSELNWDIQFLKCINRMNILNS